MDGEPALRKEDEVLRAKASRAWRAPFSEPLDLAAEKADLLSTLIASAGDVVREAAERGRVGQVFFNCGRVVNGGADRAERLELLDDIR